MSEPISTEIYDAGMEAALDQARQAVEHGDVPIGAALLDNTGSIVTADHNRRELLNDPTAHAEILVLSARARQIGNWRLHDHTLIVTLEPCAMCAGAAVLSRIDRIVYGAADPKAGAAWSLYNIPQDSRLNHRIDLVDGVLASECAGLLETYFGELRA